MPRAPTLEKIIDQLIVLIINDPRITEDDLKIIVPKIKSLINDINIALHRN